MARRFAHAADIEWVGCDPTPFQPEQTARQIARRDALGA
jgi:hypothetical protein